MFDWHLTLLVLCHLSLKRADFAKLHKQDYKDWKTQYTEVYSDICGKNNLLHLRFCLGLTPSSILQSGCCIVSRMLRRHSDKLTFDLWDKTSLNWIVFILSDICVKTVSYWLYELLSDGQKNMFCEVTVTLIFVTFDPPKIKSVQSPQGILEILRSHEWDGRTAWNHICLCSLLSLAGKNKEKVQKS